MALFHKTTNVLLLLFSNEETICCGKMFPNSLIAGADIRFDDHNPAYYHKTKFGDLL